MARLNIAIIGGDEPLAETLLKELDERDLPIGVVHPLALGEAETCITYQGEDIPCESVVHFDWMSVDLVFVTSRSPAVRKAIDAALGAGRPVIALCDAVLDPGVEVTDPDRLPAELPAARLWLVPDAVATMLVRVLRPLISALGVERVDAFACLAVSHRGREGIEELREQVSQLFSLTSVEPGVFPLQIAFNLIPQVGEIGADGTTRSETALHAALRSLLGQVADRIQLTLLWAPVFYGHGIGLHLTGGAAVNLDNVRTRLAAAPGVQLMDAHIHGGCPTPVTDAMESLDVFVGRVRGGQGNAVQLWLVGDNLRLEAANLARMAERWIEKRLETVL